MPAVLHGSLPSLSALEDGFRVRYLGSLQFAASSNVTGINNLQEPLLELYTNARRRGERNRSSHPLSLVQFLDVSDYGLVVLDIEEEDGEPFPIITKVITPVSSVLMWAAVRFHARVVKKKKFGAAFVPLACSDGTVDKKHCIPLAAKHRFLVSLTHPPLFVCLHRQVASPKMVECHAFVCAASEDALTICSVLAGTKEESDRLGSPGSGYFQARNHYRLRSDGTSQSEEDAVSTLTPSSVTTLTEATSSRMTADSGRTPRSTRQRGRRHERYRRSASCPRHDNSSADEIYYKRGNTSPVMGRRYEQRSGGYTRTHSTPKLSERFLHPDYRDSPIFTKTSSCDEQIIDRDGVARRKEYKSSSSEETPPYELIASSPDVSCDRHRHHHHQHQHHHRVELQKCDQILPRYEFGQQEKSFQTNMAHAPSETDYHRNPSNHGNYSLDHSARKHQQKEYHASHTIELDPRVRTRSAMRQSNTNLDNEGRNANQTSRLDSVDYNRQLDINELKEKVMQTNGTQVRKEYFNNGSPVPARRAYRSLHDLRSPNHQYDADSLDGEPVTVVHHQSPSYKLADLDLMDHFDHPVGPVMRETGTMTEPRTKSKVTCTVSKPVTPLKANATIQTETEVQRPASFKGSMVLQETMDLSSESEYSVAVQPPPRSKQKNGKDQGVWVSPSTFQENLQKADQASTEEYRTYRSQETQVEPYYHRDSESNNHDVASEQRLRKHGSKQSGMEYYDNDGYHYSDSSHDVSGNGTSRVTINVPYYHESNSQLSQASNPGCSSRTSYLPHGIRSFQRSGEVRNWSTVSSEASYTGTATLPIPRANRHQPKVIRWSSVERLPRRRRNILSSLKRFSIRSLTRAKEKTNQLFNTLRTKVKDQMTLKKGSDVSEDSAYDTSEVCLSPDGGGKKSTPIRKHRRQSWSFHDLRAEFPTGRPSDKKNNGSTKNGNPGAGPSGAATRGVKGSRKNRKKRKAATDNEMSSDSGVEEYPSDFSDTCRRPRSKSEMQLFASDVTKIRVDHGKKARDYRRYSQTDLHSELGYIP